VRRFSRTRTREAELVAPVAGESSVSIKKRVERARQAQLERQGKPNSLLGTREIDRHCATDREGDQLLRHALARLRYIIGVSTRASRRHPMPVSSHPQRSVLNHELHARPFEALRAPQRASYLALLSQDAAKPRERECVAELCRHYGFGAPSPEANHLSIDLGPFRLKWERHTEFTSYTFLEQGDRADPFDDPVIGRVPAGWLESLPGEAIVAAHVALRPSGGEEAAAYFPGSQLVGARVGEGAATVYTDFRLHADGFSRFLILDARMNPTQAGRMMQRLLEIETYVMAALLTFPVARAVMPALSQADAELVGITSAMSREGGEDEALLERLSKLAAGIEDTISSTHYRFSAARAYYALVERRIAELREARIEGTPTFREFTERRLAPAMDTCEAVARRQGEIARRIARASELLRTRVDVKRERQNQELLASMDRRARLQLRLQETVEGLSVAAITYYDAGLVGYLAKGFSAAGLKVNPDLAVAISIPVIALLVALGVRQIRKSVTRRYAPDY